MSPIHKECHTKNWYIYAKRLEIVRKNRYSEAKIYQNRKQIEELKMNSVEIINGNGNYLDLPDAAYAIEGLPNFLTRYIITFVDEKTKRNLYLTSKVFRDFIRGFPEQLNQIFSTPPITIRNHREFQGLPKNAPLHFKVKRNVILRYTNCHIHLYDPNTGNSGMVTIPRETIDLIDLKPPYLIICTNSATRLINIQKIEAHSNILISRPLSSSIKDVLKILNNDQYLKMTSILVGFLDIKPPEPKKLKNKFEDLDDWDFIAPVINKSIEKELERATERSIIKTIKAFAGITLTLRNNGEIELLNDSTGQPVRTIRSKNNNLAINDAALHSCFLALSHTKSRTIEILNIITERIVCILKTNYEVQQLHFQEGQLTALLQDNSIQVWNPNAKAPNEALTVDMREPIIIPPNKSRFDYTPNDAWLHALADHAKREQKLKQQKSGLQFSTVQKECQ